MSAYFVCCRYRNTYLLKIRSYFTPQKVSSVQLFNSREYSVRTPANKELCEFFAVLDHAYEFKTAKLHYSYTETGSKQTHKNRHLGGL